MDDTVYWLLWRFTRKYLGLLKEARWREAKAEFKRSRSNNWKCDICGKKLGKKNQRYLRPSVDHVIPRNILYQLGLVDLIFDLRNLQLTHEICNVKRGDLTIADLPPRIRDKLFAMSSYANTPVTVPTRKAPEGARPVAMST